MDVQEDPTADKNGMHRRQPHVHGKVIELLHPAEVEV
jgi:hypothetical protein